MTYSATIQLHALKDPSRRIRLDYIDKPVRQTQARLAGRRVLEPKLDLGSYTCRAVIDWAQVSLELARPTQFRYVQEALEGLGLRKPWVVPLSPGPGGVDRRYSFRLQEPHLRDVRKGVALLEAKFGLAGEPFIDGIEVSIDFYPKVHSADSRALMVAVLSRHLWPNRNVVSAHRLNRPRFAWDRYARASAQVLNLAPADADLLLNTDGDRPPAIDATYYLGQKYAQAMWRVMDKVKDRQHPDREIWDDLSEDEKRARVEVMLDRLELKKLGVTSMDKLLALNFAKLQGSYFQFMLPTFAGTPTFADRFWEKKRQRRFLNAGVVGLQAMDDERQRLLKTHRPELVRQLRQRGVKTPPAPRTAAGRNGTLVSYQMLNDRVSSALDKLDKREGV